MRPEPELSTRHPSATAMTCAVAVDVEEKTCFGTREQLPAHSPALTIWPSITARNKAIGRTELTAAGRVIPWKAQKLIQIVLWQQSSLWNHLNYKQWKFIAKPSYCFWATGGIWTGREELEPDGGGRGFLPACCLHGISGSMKSRCLPREGEPLPIQDLFSYQHCSAWAWAQVGCKGKGTPWKHWRREVEIFSFLPRSIFIYSTTHDFILPCDSDFSSRWSFGRWGNTEKALKARKQCLQLVWPEGTEFVFS